MRMAFKRKMSVSIAKSKQKPEIKENRNSTHGRMPGNPSENGDVEKGEIVKSSTDYPEFDKAILDDLLQWKFESGEFDKCTVTVPLTFSED